MTRDIQHGRTRRVVARVAIASALALAPVAIVAAPAFAAPVALDQVNPVNARPGHGHGGWDRSRPGHGGGWNQGFPGRSDWNRGRHDHGDWNRGGQGNWRGNFPLPSTGSAF